MRRSRPGAAEERFQSAAVPVAGCEAERRRAVEGVVAQALEVRCHSHRVRQAERDGNRGDREQRVEERRPGVRTHRHRPTIDRALPMAGDRATRWARDGRTGRLTTRLDIEYDGTRFAGWARQPGLRTVQGELELALGIVLGREVTLT